MDKLLYKDESLSIRGVIFDVYKTLGNHHKEKVYRDAICYGLEARGLNVQKEKRINIYYQGKKTGTYIPDLIINDVILIELKAKIFVTTDDTKQFWYYLKNSNYKLGFLINFGTSGKVQIIRKVYDTARTK